MKTDRLLHPEKPVTAKNWKEENEKYLATEKELEEIFERTYGPIRKLGEEPPAGRSVKGWKKSRRFFRINIGALGPEKVSGRHFRII